MKHEYRNITKDEFISAILEFKTLKEIYKHLKIGKHGFNNLSEKYNVVYDDLINIEKLKEETRQRKIQNHKLSWERKTEEEKLSFRQKVSEANKEWWKNVDDNKKEEIKKNISLSLMTMDPEKKKRRLSLMGKSMSNKLLTRTDKEKDDFYNKVLMTKKRNNTFNASTLELNVYDILKSKFKQVYHNHKTNGYPFTCDFYIGDVDLYIECNFHWTHGGKPFEGTSDDLDKLSLWKEKAINSKFYVNAIDVWTSRDVRKKETFIKNKLNYKIYYTYDEFLFDFEIK